MKKLSRKDRLTIKKLDIPLTTIIKLENTKAYVINHILKIQGRGDKSLK